MTSRSWGEGIKDLVETVLESMTRGWERQKLRDVIYGRPLYSSKFDTYLLEADTSVDVINMTFEGNVFDGEDDIHEKLLKTNSVTFPEFKY